MVSAINGLSPYNNINSIAANYGTGFSLGNYTNSSPGLAPGSIFDGYNNTGNISPMAPQAPQEDNGMMQLLMSILPLLLQQANGSNGQNAVVDSEEVDEPNDQYTEINPEQINEEETAKEKERSTAEKVLDPAGVFTNKDDDRSTIKKVLDPGGLFKGW